MKSSTISNNVCSTFRQFKSRVCAKIHHANVIIGPKTHNLRFNIYSIGSVILNKSLVNILMVRCVAYVQVVDATTITAVCGASAWVNLRIKNTCSTHTLSRAPSPAVRNVAKRVVYLYTHNLVGDIPTERIMQSALGTIDVCMLVYVYVSCVCVCACIKFTWNKHI